MYKMEIINDVNNFSKFVSFMNENRDSFDKNDLIQYYNIGLSSNNTKVINFLLKEYKYIIEESYIQQSLYLLTSHEWKDMIKIFIENKVNLNELYLNIIEKFIQKLLSYHTDNDIDNYISYLVFILKNSQNLNLNKVKDLIVSHVYNNDVLKVILSIIDLVIIFGGNTLEGELSEENQLLFMHVDKSLSYVYNNLDSYIKVIVKKELDVESDRKCINYLKKRNKERFITKVKDDFYIMNDGNRNWVFDNENMKYIKKHHKNPYNGENISDDILKNI